MHYVQIMCPGEGVWRTVGAGFGLLAAAHTAADAYRHFPCEEWPDDAEPCRDPRGEPMHPFAVRVVPSERLPEWERRVLADALAREAKAKADREMANRRVS